MNGAPKQRVKQLVRRLIGEPYVGKRLKLRRLGWLVPLLGLDPAAIIDAGTEDATFVYWLADRFPAATVTAVDIDEAAIAACRATLPRAYASRVQFKAAPFADLKPESCDLITAFDVLEHIADDRKAVADLVRALRPGGALLVHVPRDRWATWSGEIRRASAGDPWINPDHVRMGYSPESMRALLTDAGMSVERIELWVGRWGVLAHEAYRRLEHPVPLRLLSLPITDLCALLDGHRSRPNGNTVFAHAVKPARH